MKRLVLAGCFALAGAFFRLSALDVRIFDGRPEIPEEEIPEEVPQPEGGEGGEGGAGGEEADGNESADPTDPTDPTDPSASAEQGPDGPEGSGMSGGTDVSVTPDAADLPPGEEGDLAGDPGFGEGEEPDAEPGSLPFPGSELPETGDGGEELRPGPPPSGLPASPGRGTEIFIPSERIEVDQAVDFPWDI